MDRISQSISCFSGFSGIVKIYLLIGENTEKSNKKLRRLLKKKRRLQFLPWHQLNQDRLCDFMDRAIKATNYDALKSLIAAGGDVNHELGHTMTILHVAARYCNTNILIDLLEGGGNVNKTTRFGTPLHFAAMGSIWEQPFRNITTLAKYGARYDSKDADGNTPLEYLFSTYNKTALTQQLDLEELLPIVTVCCLLAIGAQLNITGARTKRSFETRVVLYENTNLSEVIIQSGFKFSHLHEIEPSRLISLSGLTNVRERTECPLSLKRLAANIIRTSLQPNAIAGINKMNLPAGFDKSYITLGLIDECSCLIRRKLIGNLLSSDFPIHPSAGCT